MSLWRIVMSIGLASLGACGLINDSFESASESGATEATSTPLSLDASDGTRKITLSWPAASGSAPITYHIYRSTVSGSGFSEIASTSALSYVDSSATVEIPYFYRVSASNEKGESLPTVEASAQAWYLIENWDSNILDSSVWNQWQSGGGTLQMLNQTHRVKLAPPANTVPNGAYSNTYGGLSSVTNFNFTGLAASVEAVQMLNLSSGESGLYVAFSPLDLRTLLMYRLGSDLAFGFRAANGTRTVGLEPYNATTQRFWMISHDTVDNEIDYSVSPDGVTWTLLGSLAVPFPITSVKVEVGGGVFASEPAPGAAYFDNIKVFSAP